eukprot:7390045-Prymnesium_polylepis.1
MSCGEATPASEIECEADTETFRAGRAVNGRVRMFGHVHAEAASSPSQSLASPPRAELPSKIANRPPPA